MDKRLMLNMVKLMHNWVKTNLDRYHPALLQSTPSGIFFEIAVQDGDEDAVNFLAFCEENGIVSTRKAQNLRAELATEFED